MKIHQHPFDAYATFTDVAALKEISGKPLRKCIRVNTLKTTVPDVLLWAKQKGWNLEPVPWCKEAFYVDREDRSQALGRDLLHLLGHIYMQEAASMLPVSLLAPEPGETILDMCAAPGSKTTQIAAHLSGKGVIIANEVQEKRMWTLKHACHRLGVTNVILVKKVGQWYAKHMTERFDRVLCDAPCTAQGTARKDSDALKYSSELNAKKMSILQSDLLESAIHATKVGGRIVYSTCTLTIEENERVIAHILNKFCDQVVAVDPRTIFKDSTWCEEPIRDSMNVQDSLRNTGDMGAIANFPALRLWPQTLNTEGFFSVVLQKVAPTKYPEPMERVSMQEQCLPRARTAQFNLTLQKWYGVPFIREGETLFERGAELVLTTDEVERTQLPVQDYALGLPFGRRLSDTDIRPSSEILSLRAKDAQTNVVDLDDATYAKLLRGEDIENARSLRGDIILRYKGYVLGSGLAQEGVIKNRLPRWLVQRS